MSELTREQLEAVYDKLEEIEGEFLANMALRPAQSDWDRGFDDAAHDRYKRISRHREDISLKLKHSKATFDKERAIQGLTYYANMTNEEHDLLRAVDPELMKRVDAAIRKLLTGSAG